MDFLNMSQGLDCRGLRSPAVPTRPCIAINPARADPAACNGRRLSGVGMAWRLGAWMHRIPSLKARAPGCRRIRCAVGGRLLGPRRGASAQHTWARVLLASLVGKDARCV